MEDFTISQDVPQQSQPNLPRRKKSENGKKTNSQRKHIFSFLVMIAGLLILLSMVSYSPADEANGDIRFTDLYKIFTADSIIQQKAETTTNWLGLFGAILSNFLINSTVGFFSFFIPFLTLAWGWTTLRDGNIRKLIYFTNYVIVLGFLGSTLFSLLRIAGLSEILVTEWHGAIGAFLGTVLKQTLGLAGGIISVLALIVVTLTLAIDLDLQRTAERIKLFFVMLGEMFNSKIEEWNEQRELKAQQREEEKKKTEIEEIRQRKLKYAQTLSNEKQEGIEKKSIAINKIEEDNDQETTVQTIEPSSVVTFEVHSGNKSEDVDLGKRKIGNYNLPTENLLDDTNYEEEVSDEELNAHKQQLEDTLKEFGVSLEKIEATKGPVVTLYELVPDTGVKVAKITSLSNDLALAMQAKGIRIEAPIPGKGTVGVEIPNKNPSIVTIRSVLRSNEYKNSKAALPLVLGKTISGNVFVDDLAKMPHVLIAGATGMGKSVGINSIIASLLYRLHPSDVKFLLVDPKKIELSLYTKLEQNFLATSPDFDEKIITQPQNAVSALKSCVIEMEQRYDLLASAGVRHIVDYNLKFKDGKLKDKDTDKIRHHHLPYIIVIVDELADLMLTTAKEVEESIARIAQLARAVGIHLVIATQRPSVDVITGVIKANFPARIAYAVSSKIDSRTILDGSGAEQLIGRGDMLYLSSSSPKAVRIQNPYISTEEVEKIVDFISSQNINIDPCVLPSAKIKKNGSAGGTGERDELFDEAARIIVRHQQGSVSLLQRRLSVGYSRAARLVDQLEEAGIVGPFDGSKAREVRIQQESDLEFLLKNLD